MYDYFATYSGYTVDGDTFDCTIHLIQDVKLDARVRLLDVQTPERGKPGFEDAKQFTRSWLMDNPGFIITTKKKDSFGRWLATVESPEGQNLNQLLLDLGYATRYVRKITIRERVGKFKAFCVKICF